MLIAFLAFHAVILAAWWRQLAARGAGLPAHPALPASGLTAGEMLMCAAVLSVAQVVAIALLLGWCGMLAPRPLVVGVAATTAALLLSPVRGRGGAARDRVAAPAASSTVIWSANAVVLALLVPTLALIVLRGVQAPDFGWDGLRYHLPMSALMRQTGGFDFPPAHNPVINGYPKVGEIWTFWILAFLGTDRWLGVAQVPFLALAMLATYNAARRLGAGRGAALAGALLVPAAPVVLCQITVAYTDVFLAALVLVAVALILAASQSRAAALSPTLGATLGLLLGAKFSGLLFAPFLFAAYAAVAVVVSRRRALPGLALAALLALLLGGDTYVRNLRRHGNPVYPYQTALLGRALPGPLPDDSIYGVSETLAVPLPTRLWRSWSAVDMVMASGMYGGFGWAGPWLLVLVVLSLAIALRERDRTRLLLFALFAVLLLLTPLNFRLRFVIFLLGLGGISLSHLLERAGPRGRAALMVVTIAVAIAATRQLWSAELPRLRRAAAAPDACREAPAAALRPAYLWLRANGAGGTVVTFPPAGFDYCLWTPAVSNRVEFASAATAAELERLDAQPAALFFLPRGGTAHAAFAASDPARWRVVFDDAGAVIATRRPAP